MYGPVSIAQSPALSRPQVVGLQPRKPASRENCQPFRRQQAALLFVCAATRPPRTPPSERQPAAQVGVPTPNETARRFLGGVQDPLLNESYSQAFARFHSRMTVTSEMCSASAVSSTLNPPKKRSSTTLLFRESMVANRFSASSSAIKSAPRSGEPTIVSSNEILCAPPPRFPYCRLRA